MASVFSWSAQRLDILSVSIFLVLLGLSACSGPSEVDPETGLDRYYSSVAYGDTVKLHHPPLVTLDSAMKWSCNEASRGGIFEWFPLSSKPESDWEKAADTWESIVDLPEISDGDTASSASESGELLRDVVDELNDQCSVYELVISGKVVFTCTIDPDNVKDSLPLCPLRLVNRSGDEQGRAVVISFQYPGTPKNCVDLGQTEDNVVYWSVQCRDEYLEANSPLAQIGIPGECQAGGCDTGISSDLGGPDNRRAVKTIPPAYDESLYQKWDPNVFGSPANVTRVAFAGCEFDTFGFASVYYVPSNGIRIDGEGAFGSYQLWFRSMTGDGQWNDGPHEMGGQLGRWPAQKDERSLSASAGTPLITSQLVWAPEIERWALAGAYFGRSNATTGRDNFSDRSPLTGDVKGIVRGFLSGDPLGTSWSSKILKSGSPASEVRMAWNPSLNSSAPSGKGGGFGVVWEDFAGGNRPNMYFRFLDSGMNDLSDFGTVGLRISDRLGGRDVFRNDAPDIASFSRGFVTAWWATFPDWQCLDPLALNCPPPPGVDIYSDLGFRVFFATGDCSEVQDDSCLSEERSILDRGGNDIGRRDRDVLEQGMVRNYPAPSIAVTKIKLPSGEVREYAGIVWYRASQSTREPLSGKINLYIIDLSGSWKKGEPFGELVQTITLDEDNSGGLRRAWPEIGGYPGGFAVTWWNDNISCIARLRGAILTWVRSGPPRDGADPAIRFVNFEAETFDKVAWTNPLTGTQCEEGKSHPTAQFGHPHSIALTECPTIAVAEGRAFAQLSLN